MSSDDDKNGTSEYKQEVSIPGRKRECDESVRETLFLN